MVALFIILGIIALAIVLAVSYVCGRITCELVHQKNPKLNEVMWFWLGFAFSWLGILLTLVVKKEEQQ
ncbi:MAG: hypothetical protein E7346_02870 [Clostridiales bacterium]|nr:hypothetical protein [Clostridiales bacterium]MBQ3046979.1 hypothetical protein [Clostridia bacterium]